MEVTFSSGGCVLAKIQMVTKLMKIVMFLIFRCVLAKIQMVTKRSLINRSFRACCVLAKIQMVTKPQKYISIFLNLFKTMIVT